MLKRSCREGEKQWNSQQKRGNFLIKGKFFFLKEKIEPNTQRGKGNKFSTQRANKNILGICI